MENLQLYVNPVDQKFEKYTAIINIFKNISKLTWNNSNKKKVNGYSDFY